MNQLQPGRYPSPRAGRSHAGSEADALRAAERFLVYSVGMNPGAERLAANGLAVISRILAPEHDPKAGFYAPGDFLTLRQDFIGPADVLVIESTGIGPVVDPMATVGELAQRGWVVLAGGGGRDLPATLQPLGEIAAREIGAAVAGIFDDPMLVLRLFRYVP